MALTPGLTQLDYDQPAIKALDLDRVGSGPRPWNSLEALGASRSFFIVVTDRTGGHRGGIWPDAMGKTIYFSPPS